MAETFGAYLKQERELRSISLAELSEQTHVKLEYLEAIESNHFERLPGLTFAKGFLQAYAKYIGLEPDDVLLRFEDTLKQLSGAGKFRTDRENPGLFWMVSFSILFVIATVILLWFRK